VPISRCAATMGVDRLAELRRPAPVERYWWLPWNCPSRSDPERAPSVPWKVAMAYSGTCLRLCQQVIGKRIDGTGIAAPTS